jgi:hypothetical protein
MTEKTLADHAEAWAKSRGERVPPRNTDAWRDMYERWIEHAFSFGKEGVTNGNGKAQNNV